MRTEFLAKNAASALAAAAQGDFAPPYTGWCTVLRTSGVLCGKISVPAGLDIKALGSANKKTT